MLLWIAAFVVFICYVVKKKWQYWKERGVNQASILYILKSNYHFFAKKVNVAEATLLGYNLFPNARYIGTYQFTKPIIMLKDPDLIKEVTIKSFDSFMDHTQQIPENADPFWSKNLVALKGQTWRDMRSILSPSFTSSKMRIMFSLMLECAENFSKHFAKKNQDIVEVEMKDIFTRFTNDVIATTAFGVKVDSLENQNNEFYVMGKTISNMNSFSTIVKFFVMLMFPKICGILKISLFDERTRTFFTKLIDDTIELREEKGIWRPDMIQLMMEARKGVQSKEEISVNEGFATAKESENTTTKLNPKDITNIDITAQALIFFLAGFETVATTMCFMGYELAVNPDYQNKLREEILETLKQCQGKLTYEALLKMKYMDMVVTESLRKWPAAVITERQCTKSFTIPSELPDEKPVLIKKGFSVWMPVFPIHRDPKHYPDPDTFDPERFNEENKSRINPYTYLPFGLGPRNCIGSRFALLEIKVVFFILLQHFEIVPIERSQIPLKLSKKHFNLTAEKGFWFGLKRL